jgi:hypothetical protein
MLRPKKSINKCLISSPARIVGEYESSDILITHAWPELMAPNARRHRFEPGPTYRSFFIVSFETEDIADEEKRTRPMPNYHWLGDFFTVCLGVFFGKRFDHHGLVETQGMFCLPSYQSIREIAVYNLAPYNSKPRVDLEIELNLTRLETIASVLHLQGNQSAFNTFFTAGNFYLRSLRLVEEQPETAYLDLVTAGEILSNYFTYTDEELFADDLLTLFIEIRDQLADGENKANKIKSRMYQVRRRYTLTLRKLLNDNFFTKTEATENWAALKSEEIESAILAAYDLRSRYVHTGERFGGWVHGLEHVRAERQVGTPVVDDKDYEKILVKAPTFIGLERIMRYCLLRFVHSELCPIDPRLN